MDRFVVYYWLEQAGKGRPVCESLTASSFDEATLMVQERLKMHSFYFDSVTDGRMIVVSGHVQYVEIEAENATNADCVPEGMDTMDVIERMNRQEM